MTCWYKKGKLMKNSSFKPMNKKTLSTFNPSASYKEADFRFPSYLEGLSPTEDTPSNLTQEMENIKKEEEQSHREAQGILAEAKAEAQKIKMKAYQEGWQEGESKAGEELKKKVSFLQSALEKGACNLEKIQKDVLEKKEEEILHFCLAIAKKIIHTEIRQNPQIILANIREGLKAFGQCKILSIKLHPSDLEILKTLNDKSKQLSFKINEVPLETDLTLEQGGCFIRTDLGYIDATIENQIQELSKEVLAK